jgi:hypothetical protein
MPHLSECLMAGQCSHPVDHHSHLLHHSAFGFLWPRDKKLKNCGQPGPPPRCPRRATTGVHAPNQGAPGVHRLYHPIIQDCHGSITSLEHTHAGNIKRCCSHKETEKRGSSLSFWVLGLHKLQSKAPIKVTS